MQLITPTPDILKESNLLKVHSARFREFHGDMRHIVELRSENAVMLVEFPEN